MEREASSAAPAGREENNRLNDCRTFGTSAVGGGSNERREEAINDFHQ